MKIVQINSIYGEKSTGSIVQALDLLLEQKKIESYIVYRNTTVPLPNGIQVGNKLEWTSHALRTRVDGKQGYGSWIGTKKLIRKLDKIRPDVLHLHNVHSNFLNLQLLVQYAKNKSIPIVLTLHDCWFFTGKCYHFADIGCEKWMSGCGQCPKRRMDIPSLLLDSSANVFLDRMRIFSYDKLYVVGCSNWIASMAEKSPIFATAKFRVIYNGIDTDVFCPTSIAKAKQWEQMTIVTMANKWFEEANFAVRERVMGELRPSDQLVIVGCTKEQCQKYAGDSRIVTIGYIRNPRELAKLYARGNVFLNLTHIDTLPTVNMEAISCGVPVITYDAGGSGELVHNGKTGYIVKVDDIDGVINALTRIRSGAITSEACRMYAQANFDKIQNYKKYIQLYREIVSRYGGRKNDGEL